MVEGWTWVFGRWTGIVTYSILVLDVSMMELFRFRQKAAEDWLGSRIHADRFHRSSVPRSSRWRCCMRCCSSSGTGATM